MYDGNRILCNCGCGTVIMYAPKDYEQPEDFYESLVFVDTDHIDLWMQDKNC